LKRSLENKHAFVAKGCVAFPHPAAPAAVADRLQMGEHTGEQVLAVDWFTRGFDTT
jgi:coproporphyrinogen III oxidase